MFMYLLFSPMYLNKNSISYFAKFNEIIFIGFTVLDRKAECCNLVANIYMQLVFPEFLEKELHKFQDNLPYNLEICNISNWQKRNSLGFSPLYGSRDSLKIE